MLLPLCAVAVATLEGATAGTGFALAVGVIFDAMDPGVPGAMIFIMALLGLGAGLLSQYVLRQDLVGCFLCSVLALVVMDALRIAVRPRSYICEASAWGSLPHDLRALALYHTGSYQAAAEEAGRALALEPGDQRLKENLRLMEQAAGL